LIEIIINKILPNNLFKGFTKKGFLDRFCNYQKIYNDFSKYR